MKTTMPGNSPGGLDDRVYADVLAYLLEAHGLPAGQRELSPEMVGRIQLVGPEGPRPWPTSLSCERSAVSRRRGARRGRSSTRPAPAGSRPDREGDDAGRARRIGRAGRSGRRRFRC
jgi:hypothetical protein